MTHVDPTSLFIAKLPNFDPRSRNANRIEKFSGTFFFPSYFLRWVFFASLQSGKKLPDAVSRVARELLRLLKEETVEIRLWKFHFPSRACAARELASIERDFFFPWMSVFSLIEGKKENRFSFRLASILFDKFFYVINHEQLLVIRKTFLRYWYWWIQQLKLLNRDRYCFLRKNDRQSGKTNAVAFNAKVLFRLFRTKHVIKISCIFQPQSNR